MLSGFTNSILNGKKIDEIRKSIKQIEEGKDLAPKFDKFGLILS